jgi:hypothetical protein
MTDDAVVAIARIPLARSARRMGAVPAALVLAGVLAAIAGWFVGGWAGIGLAVAGALVGVLAAYLAVVIFSLRLEVEVSALRLHGVRRDQRFTLVRGAVTRVPLAGDGAARLQPRFGALGWGVGPARLRGEERIQLVRLAPTRSMILVPTDGGRVGVAPASEEQLIAALAAAARVQQRLDQVAARARPMPVDHLVEAEPRAPAPIPVREMEPGRVLTGIERVLLEERLAAERAAALAAAEAERRRAEEQAAAALAAAEAADAVAAAQALPPGPQAGSGTVGARPAWARVPRPRVSLPARRELPRERLVQYATMALPAFAALVLWMTATVSGRLDLPESESRLAAASLALVGPAGAIGALAARAWFPRITWVVIVASLCSLVLIGRALLG